MRTLDTTLSDITEANELRDSFILRRDGREHHPGRKNC